jgi:hypothetical protein
MEKWLHQKNVSELFVEEKLNDDGHVHVRAHENGHDLHFQHLFHGNLLHSTRSHHEHDRGLSCLYAMHHIRNLPRSIRRHRVHVHGYDQDYRQRGLHSNCNLPRNIQIHYQNVRVRVRAHDRGYGDDRDHDHLFHGRGIHILLHNILQNLYHHDDDHGRGYCHVRGHVHGRDHQKRFPVLQQSLLGTLNSEDFNQ